MFNQYIIKLIGCAGTIERRINTTTATAVIAIIRALYSDYSIVSITKCKAGK